MHESLNLDPQHLSKKLGTATYAYNPSAIRLGIGRQIPRPFQPASLAAAESLRFSWRPFSKHKVDQGLTDLSGLCCHPVTSRNKLHPRAMSGSMVLPQSRFVLISMTPVTTEGCVDA